MFKLSITTTQNIPLFFTPASIGERILAFIIDFCIQMGYFSLLIYVLTETDIFEYILKMDAWSMYAIFLLITAPAYLYPLVCESFMSGQTLGKRVLKIRVVKIDGYQASFYDYAIRWVFGIVEVYTIGLIGLFSMMFSKYSQRLGDLAAGVAVISLKNKTNISHTILTEIEEEYKPYFIHSQVVMFSDNDVQIIKTHYTNALAQQDFTLIKKLSDKIKEVSQYPNSELNSKDFVERFLKDFNYYTK